MKVKRMGIIEILRGIYIFSANEIKSSESFSNQPTQLIVQVIIGSDNWLISVYCVLNNNLMWALSAQIDCNL